MTILELFGFNDWLIKLLNDYRCKDSVLVHPTKRVTKKADFRDVNALGELLWVNRKRLKDGKSVQNLKRVILPPETDVENWQLTTLRGRVTTWTTRTFNKIQKILVQHNHQQDCPTKGLQTHTAAG